MIDDKTESLVDWICGHWRKTREEANAKLQALIGLVLIEDRARRLHVSARRACYEHAAQVALGRMGKITCKYHHDDRSCGQCIERWSEAKEIAEEIMKLEGR